MAATYHGYVGYVVIVNRKFWDGLPADVRTTLTSAMREATIFANDIASEANNDAVGAIAASGKTEVIRLTPEQRAQWKKALVVVRHEVEGRIGKDLIQAIENEVGHGSH